MNYKFKVFISTLILFSVLAMLISSILITFLLKPNIFIKDIEGYINGILSSTLKGDILIQKIEGNFINGFKLGPVNYTDENKVILSIQEIFIDPDLSSMIFGTLSLSEVIVNNSYFNLDDFEFTKARVANNNINFPMNYRITKLNINDMLFLYDDNQFNIRGELDISYDNSYKFDIRHLNIESSHWLNELAINSGKVTYSNNEFNIMDLESKGDFLSFKLYHANINPFHIYKSTGNLLISHYHNIDQDSNYVRLEKILVNIQNIKDRRLAYIKGDMQYNNNISAINIEGEFINNLFLFKNAEFSFKKQRIITDGSFDLKNRTWEITTSLNDITLFNNLSLSGNYNIKGTNKDEKIFGNIHCNEVYVDSIYFGEIIGNYRYNGNVLKSNSIKLSSKNINLSVSTNFFNNIDHFNIFGKVNFNNFNGNIYFNDYKIDSLYGSIEYDIIKEPNATVFNTISKFDEGIILGNPFENITADFNGKIIDNKYEGMLTGFIDKWKYGPYQWEKINYLINYSDLDSSFSKISALSVGGDSIEIFANRSMNADYIKVNLSGQLKNEKLYTTPFYINRKNGYFQIPDLNIFIGQSIANLSFNYRNKDNFAINGKLSDINLSKLYSIIGKTFRIYGVIDHLDFKIQKNSNIVNPIILLNASLNSGSIDDINFNHMQLSSSYRNNRLLLSDLQLYTDLGNILGNGWFNINLLSMTNKLLSDHKLDLLFTYKNIDLFKFNRYLPLPIEVRGLASGQVKIGGIVSNPIIYSTMKIASPGFDKFEGTELNGKLHYKNNRMDFTNLLLLTKYGKYTGNGHMPMDLSFIANNNKSDLMLKPIDFMFIGKTNNLEFIPKYFDAIDSLTTSDKINNNYTYSLQLLMTGSISDPIRNGMLIIQNGSLYLDAINEPIKDIIGNISITNNQLIIEKLFGTLTATAKPSVFDNVTKYLFYKSERPTSNINIYGSMNLTELLNPNYALTIKADNISLSSSYDLFNGMMDANIDVTGKDTILISGDLIPSAYNFTVTSLGEQGNYQSGKIYTKRKIAYDIHIPIEETIKIKTDNIDFFIEGDLSIAKIDEDEFNFSGKADIIEGNFYDNQGNIYTNTFGTILFSPIDNAPLIDLNAQTEIDGNLIDIAFVGYTDNPTLIINSPHHNYTQTEILQILTFGNSGDDLVDSENASSLLSNFIENEIEKNISKYTPLDEFQLTSNSSILNTIEGDDNIDLKVILGKQFTNKIYVNTEFDINDFHNSKYQATYRLNKKTSIVGGVDVENKWHFRYRYKFYY